MTKRAISGFNSRAAVGLEWIVTVIASGGFNDRAVGLDFSSGRNKVIDRIGHVPAIPHRHFSAHNMSRSLIEIRGQRGFECVSQHAGTDAREHAALVIIGLQRLGERRLSGFSLVNIFPANDFCQDVILVIALAAFPDFLRGDGKSHAIRIEIVEINRLAPDIAHIERHHGPAVSSNHHGSDFRLKPAEGALGMNARQL